MCCSRKTDLEMVTEDLAQKVNRPYLRTPRHKIIRAACLVQQKRQEFLASVARGVAPNDSPEAPRRRYGLRRHIYRNIYLWSGCKGVCKWAHSRRYTLRSRSSSRLCFVCDSFAGGTWDWEYLGFASPEVTFKLLNLCVVLKMRRLSRIIIIIIIKKHN